MEEWMSPQQLADLLRVPLGTVYCWRARDDGPPGYRIGKHVRYRRSDVDAWIESKADQAKGA